MISFSDACGIVGVSIKNNNDVVRLAFFGLNGIQHRGQENTGIAVSCQGNIRCFKDNGLVTDVMDDHRLSLLQGDRCLGYVGCSRDHTNFSNGIQPFVVNYSGKSISIVFNGGLRNSAELREELEKKGAIFTSKSDCETVAYCIAQNDKGDLVAAIKNTMRKLHGGYAFAVLTHDRIIGVRDPLAIRPLCLGTIEGGYLLASESCALDLMGGELLRDVKPGEIVEITDEGFHFHETVPMAKTTGCIFEYIYFARPDSTIDHYNVFKSRELSGRILARESPVEADIVIGVPDSGTPAATGFAQESGIPYSASMIKNKYIGRTFVINAPKKRETNIRIKLNPIKEYVQGKRVVLVDDSIVRGTTMRNIIATIKNLGAASVHLRISSPAVLHCCYFGGHILDEKDLLAKKYSKDEIAQYLDADSLEYLSIEGLARSVGGTSTDFCNACLNGHYPEV